MIKVKKLPIISLGLIMGKNGLSKRFNKDLAHRAFRTRWTYSEFPTA